MREVKKDTRGRKDVRTETEYRDRRGESEAPKGHERDSDMHDICKTRRLRSLTDRRGGVNSFLTFGNTSIPVLHRAGDFSGRQRGGRTLGPLRRGRGQDDEKKKKIRGRRQLFKSCISKPRIVCNKVRSNSPLPRQPPSETSVQE